MFLTMGNGRMNRITTGKKSLQHGKDKFKAIFLFLISLLSASYKLTGVLIDVATHPNKLTNPKSSIKMPTLGHRRNTMMIPAKNVDVPFHFRIWKKKLYALLGPMTSVTPAKKSTCSQPTNQPTNQSQKKKIIRTRQA